MGANMRKIIFHINSLEQGGAERVITNLAHQFAAEGYEVYILSLIHIFSSVAVSIFFMYFFIKDGIGTRLFTLFGFDNTTWFTSTKYALLLVIIIYVWQQIGFYMILYISGLQNISAELYEAGRIDGTNKAQAIWYITLPLVKPTTYLVITPVSYTPLDVYKRQP